MKLATAYWRGETLSIVTRNDRELTDHLQGRSRSLGRGAATTSKLAKHVRIDGSRRYNAIVKDRGGFYLTRGAAQAIRGHAIDTDMQFKQVLGLRRQRFGADFTEGRVTLGDPKGASRLDTPPQGRENPDGISTIQG